MVCVSRGLQSPLTYLPDINYIHSGSVEVPFSHLPDYSDVSHMVITETVTAMELFNRFANEIRDMDHLDEIVNGRETGYCACNNRDPVHRGTFDSFKVQLKYFEVKSVDYIGVAKSKSKKGLLRLQKKLTEQNTSGVKTHTASGGLLIQKIVMVSKGLVSPIVRKGKKVFRVSL